MTWVLLEVPADIDAAVIAKNFAARGVPIPVEPAACACKSAAEVPSIGVAGCPADTFIGANDLVVGAGNTLRVRIDDAVAAKMCDLEAIVDDDFVDAKSGAHLGAVLVSIAALPARPLARLSRSSTSTVPAPKVAWCQVHVPSGTDLRELVEAFAGSTIPVRGGAGAIGSCSGLDIARADLYAAIELLADADADELDELVGELDAGRLVGLRTAPVADLSESPQHYEAPSPRG